MIEDQRGGSKERVKRRGRNYGKGEMRDENKEEEEQVGETVE